MSILAKPTNDRLAEKRALLSSVRERITYLRAEIQAQGRSGRNDRRARLVSEVQGLERTAGSLTASIKQAEAAALIHRQPKRVFSQAVER